MPGAQRYAEFIRRDNAGIGWQGGILGLDPEADPDGVTLCWNSHLARAR